MIQRARVLSYLALWPGLYVAAGVVFILQIAGVRLATPAAMLSVVFAASTGTGTYLLDRVKLRDVWLDPADALAHPARYALLARHSRAVRAGAFVLLGAAAAAGAASPSPWLAGLPLAAAAGVVLYAPRPRGAGPRVKDVLLVKNLYVSGGITGFALLVALAGTPPGWIVQAWPALALAAATLFVRVVADAVLCDLDDQESDRAHGTATLPTALGRRRAWRAAMAARLGVGAVLLATPWCPGPARLAWGVLTIASSLLLRRLNPAAVRDWVDARFALEAIIATVALEAANVAMTWSAR